ncbi:MAG: hypothetical protein LBK59_04835 [Bifidobacteriaceae bacterium]|nr:hypothetical protein [Bifidobacteriaceae bacterium]
MRRWTGNSARTVPATRAHLAQMAATKAGILDEWERDARTLTGQDARNLILTIHEDAGTAR